MFDHLPLCMYINLPVNIMYFSDSLYCMPKPKWSSANELMLSEYHHILDLSLQNINLPDVAALLNAAKCSIQFSTTKRHNNKSPH